MTKSFSIFWRHGQRLKLMTNYIGSQLDNDDLSLSELADIACLSVSQMLRLYQGGTRESPMQTLRRLRLQRAHDALSGGQDLSVTQLAYAAGYGSNAAFTHAFRRQFGHAPSATPVRAGGLAAALPALRLEHLPEHKAWQFSYRGCYGDNGYYKVRLHWLCYAAGGCRMRTWRANDRDHPFSETASVDVALTHFVPVAQQPRILGEADLVTRPGGLYAVMHVNPDQRAMQMALLGERLREDLGCVRIDGPILERDLHPRHLRPPQERCIALYLPVAPLTGGGIRSRLR